jgi:hypothetical protein
MISFIMLMILSAYLLSSVPFEECISTIIEEIYIIESEVCSKGVLSKLLLFNPNDYYKIIYIVSIFYFNRSYPHLKMNELLTSKGL